MYKRDYFKWVALMQQMVKIYGVTSAMDNLDSEHTLDDEGIWFTCPECGEPILEEDWMFDEVCVMCPVCEAEYGAYF